MKQNGVGFFYNHQACVCHTPSAPTYPKKKKAQIHVTLFLTASFVRPPSLSDSRGLSDRYCAPVLRQNAHVHVPSSSAAAAICSKKRPPLINSDNRKKKNLSFSLSFFLSSLSGVEVHTIT